MKEKNPPTNPVSYSGRFLQRLDFITTDKTRTISQLMAHLFPRI